MMMLYYLQYKQNKAVENKYKLLNSPTKQVRFWRVFFCNFDWCLILNWVFSIQIVKNRSQ